MIFDPVLVGPVDTGLPEHDRLEAVDPGIVDHVLIPGTLRTPVGGVEVQRPALRNPLEAVGIGVAAIALGHRQIDHLAVHLVRRAVDHDRLALGQTHRLEHVERTEGVDFEVGARITDRSRHRHLCREVVDDLDLLDQLTEDLLAPTGVSGHDPDGITVLLAQPRRVFRRTHPREVVEDRDPLPLAQIVVGQVGPDEPGSAGYQIAVTHRGLSSCSPPAIPGSKRLTVFGPVPPTDGRNLQGWGLDNSPRP